MILKIVWCLAVLSPCSALTVCYGDLGCFSNAAPFNNANFLLPQSPDDIQVKFLLFTRDNPEVEELLNPYDDTTITNSNYDGYKSTFFLIHGNLGNAKLDYLMEMKTALLQKEDCNVISVDWKEGASGSLSPAQAAANTRVVGAVLWKMMASLVDTGTTTYGMMTLVGYSFGAHVAGYAENHVNGHVGQIFGLDAAGPFFEGSEAVVRLDPTDAVYVEAIHTDAGELVCKEPERCRLIDLYQNFTVFKGLGISQAVGNADFYPNGGSNQPECNFFTDLLNSCSHRRSVYYFIESITSSNCLFTGRVCRSKKSFLSGRCKNCKLGCADMGLNGVTKREGVFYLHTSGFSPYCIP